MENLLLWIATSLLFNRPAAPRTFQRQYIGHTGCSVCVLSDSDSFESTWTPSHDTMYINEMKDGSAVYGVIAIDLFEPTDNLDHAEGILGQFMNSLHSTFDIEHHTGLINGYTQTAHRQVRGIVDYWQDTDGIDWKVKGWTNGQVVSLLYVKNINEVPVHRQDFFLDSFQF